MWTPHEAGYQMAKKTNEWVALPSTNMDARHKKYANRNTHTPAQGSSPLGGLGLEAEGPPDTIVRWVSGASRCITHPPHSPAFTHTQPFHHFMSSQQVQ